MPRGIVIAGLNGCGKTTLGRELAKALGYKHMDIEGYYFPASDIPYSVSRTREEVIQLMHKDVLELDGFVITAVNGDLGGNITQFYELAVLLEVPANIRAERIRRRAYEKFGERVMPGGDMYEQEQRFFDVAASRDPEEIKHQTEALHCPLIRLDGTKPISDNVKLIMEHYKLL